MDFLLHHQLVQLNHTPVPVPNSLVTSKEDEKLIDWIKFLLKNDIIEILIISMDKDGTLTGYDKNLLDYLKKFDDMLEKHLSILYAGGIENIEDIKQIEALLIPRETIILLCNNSYECLLIYLSCLRKGSIPLLLSDNVCESHLKEYIKMIGGGLKLQKVLKEPKLENIINLSVFSKFFHLSAFHFYSFCLRQRDCTAYSDIHKG